MHHTCLPTQRLETAGIATDSLSPAPIAVSITPTYNSNHGLFALRLWLRTLVVFKGAGLGISASCVVPSAALASDSNNGFFLSHMRLNRLLLFCYIKSTQNRDNSAVIQPQLDVSFLSEG
ncbi:uncharacterized protein SETTUDRAFT_37479 [Exserohilum turcica Et28A]|uniref:Uncharacterized protein n=1 Tax=Exserohilum turcicum (strain 28A) TaxID=671987 RepID=R0IYH8_EXST2|nr:uncharacterized protein SETTUDRAFT_37479 [Exserohilum turcica Et28A]EOA89830.1 hypothetical protein SETTUDRAFT_37479 [Exserohilum turcica Et28A]